MVKQRQRVLCRLGGRTVTVAQSIRLGGFSRGFDWVNVASRVQFSAARIDASVDDGAINGFVVISELAFHVHQVEQSWAIGEFVNHSRGQEFGIIHPTSLIR